MSGLFTDDSEKLPAPPAAGPGLFGDAPAPPQAQAPAPAAPPSTPYRVLARKYRPTGFADLIGQEAMVRTLRNAFALGRIAHAFMLTGVRGVGKTTTARIIARALNCTGPDGAGGPTIEPCGVCPNCRAILADRHPDVVEMDAASNNGVDEVREIIASIRVRPIEARTRVFVLDEVHMLSKPAFNALLKTLEEPPEHVKFILATTDIRKVPITVLSRCQRFDLRRVSVGELAAHFGRICAAEGVAVAPAALDLIARAADGSVRDGLSLLDQAIAQGAEGGGEIGAGLVEGMMGLADRGRVFDLFERAMAGDVAAMLAATDAMYERGADLGVVLRDLLDLTHTLSRLKAVPGLADGDALPESERVRGAALAERLSVPVLGRAWQMLLKGIAEVDAAPDRRAAAEMVLIRLAYAADLPPPGELVRQLTEGEARAPTHPVPAQPAPTPPSGTPGAGLRAVAGAGSHAGIPGAARAPARSAPSAPPSPATPPSLASWRDVIAEVAAAHEAVLCAHLMNSVHLVRFAPPVIELRPEPAAPRDLAPRLAALLQQTTGTRWTIALSADPGAPTEAKQDDDARAARRAEAARHPLVRAILDAFPGATISAVGDPSPGAGAAHPPPDPVLGGEAVGFGQTDPDMPDFAPLDAGFAGDESPDEPPDEFSDDAAPFTEESDP